MLLDKRIFPLRNILNSQYPFIKIEKDKAIATNGNILIELPLNMPVEKEFYISKEQIKQLTAGNEHLIRYEDDKVIIDNIIIEQPDSNFKFPDYKKVYPPDKDMILRVAVNFELLEKVINILKGYLNKKKKKYHPIQSLVFSFYNCGDGAIVQFEFLNEDSEYINGLLMSLRNSYLDKVTEWIKIVKEHSETTNNEDKK